MKKLGRLCFGLMIFLLAACGPARSNKTCPTAEAGAEQIPASIRQAADQIVLSRVGERFFEQCACFRPELSSYEEGDPTCIEGCAAFISKPHYYMTYWFEGPEFPTTLTGEFVVDAEGSLVAEREAAGLPDCANDPRECVFKVKDAAAAISIAEKAGLEPGLEPWSTHFHWYGGELNTYVWTVQNTLESNTYGGTAYGSGGRIVIIDANSGEVLQTNEWVVIP